ncbi:MAG: rRNA adenine N-6-methyltransferase family protein [Ilumatobacteraceae bacterium]
MLGPRRAVGVAITITNIDNGLSLTCRNTNGFVAIPYGISRSASTPTSSSRSPTSGTRRSDPAVVLTRRSIPFVSVLSRADVQRLLAEHRLAARRDLGQNFVGDPNTVRRIARLAGVGPGDHVVEIGPGLGSLTLALAETGATVVAVEVDRGIVPVLRDVVRDCPNVTVVEGDAMRLGGGPRCSPVPTTGCSSRTCRTTWRPRSWPICSTGSRRSSGCW